MKKEEDAFHTRCCPFCGFDDTQIEPIDTYAGPVIGGWVVCRVCGAKGPPARFAAEAVACWNGYMPEMLSADDDEETPGA